MLTRWLRRGGTAAKRQRAAPFAEVLEPRLLYSADAAALLAVPTSDTPDAPEVRTLQASLEYQATPRSTAQVDEEEVRAAYAASALNFEANQGQYADGVDFAAFGNGYAIQLSGGDATIALLGAPQSVGLTLLGANDSTATGEQLLATRTNHLVGDQSQWVTDVRNYASVLYRDVYEGVDVRYYANQRQLEYDFIVGAGADAAQIALHFSGTDSVRIDDNGDLLLRVAGTEGELRFQAPVSYQDGANGREAVASRYVLREDGSVGFELGAYDHTRALVIDPVLTHATYFGGDKAENALGVAVGSDGYVYITGRTLSDTGALVNKAAGGVDNQDVYVAKFTANLGTLVWATRIGGTSDEQGNGIAVDASGQVAVTGWTKSNNFPTTTGSGFGGGQDAFVAKLNANGTALVFGAYAGSSGTDEGNAVAVDASGNVYAAGQLGNSAIIGGSDAAFVYKYDGITGARLLSVSYNGSGDESATGIAVDASGNIYVSGVTTSASGLGLLGIDLLGGILGSGDDGFLVKYNAAGAKTFEVGIGGSNDDTALALATDGTGKVAVVGQTKNAQTGGFTTTSGAFRTTAYTHTQGFLRIYDTTQPVASSLTYSSFLGGSRDAANNQVNGIIDRPTGVGFMPGGRIVVAGTTTSSDLQRTSDGATRLTNNDAYGFLQFLDTTQAGAAELLYGTYYGRKLDPGNVATNGNLAYFVGSTDQAGWSAGAGLNTTSAGVQDALVALFTLPNTAPVLSGTNNLPTISEDTTSPTGMAVSALVSGFFTDVDPGTQAGIAVTATGAGGTWQYSTDGGTNWIAIPAVAQNSAWLLAGDAQTRLRFLPDPNFAGGSSISFRGWDGSSGTAGSAADASSTGGRTAFSTAERSAVVAVTAINDAPLRTAGTVANVTVNEGSTGTSLGLTGLAYSPGGGTDEAAQTLTYTVTALPSAAFGQVQLANGTPVVQGNSYLLTELTGMKFRPATGVNAGTGTFSFSVHDNGGTAGGGADTLSESLTITVVNQAPLLSGANNLPTLSEDPATNTGALVSDIIAGKITDTEATLGIAVTALDNSKGHWEYASTGSNWVAFGTVSDTAAFLLLGDAQTRVRFVPDLNQNGSAGLSFRAWDTSTGTALGTANTQLANGGTTAFSTNTVTATVSVTPVNDLPLRTGTLSNVSVLTGTTQSLGLSGVSYGPGGGTDEATQGLTYTVTAVPVSTLGQVKIGTTVVTAGTSYNWAQFQSMVFVPASGVYSGSGTFSFSVKDSGGTASGGSDTLAQSFTIAVIQTAPVLSSVDTPSAINEDTTATIKVRDLVDSTRISDPDPGALIGIAITGLDSSHGTWQYNIRADGQGWVDIDGLSDTNALLLTDANQSKLRFIPDANFFGSATFTVRAWDRTSGTEGSLVNASSHGGTTAFSDEAVTVTLTVRPVNDAPVRTAGTVSNLTVLENSGTTLLGLAGVAYDHGGGTYENGQTLTYRVTVVPTALGDILLADNSVVTANTFYSLADLQGMRFRAGTNATGGPAAFTWQVKDTGGTANGGVDTLTQTINITIASTNQAPTLNGANPLDPVLEDATTNAGTLVSTLIAGQVTDLNVNPLSGIALTGTDTSRGRWEYSTNGGTTWNNLGTVSDSQARLLASDSRIRFVQTSGDWNGTLASALTFRAWDRTNGTVGGQASTNTNGGSSAFSTAHGTSSLTVTAVNDAPVRTGTLANVSVLENSGTTSLGLSTVDYGPGGGSDEAAQSLLVTVTAVPSGLGDILLQDGVTVVTVNSTWSVAQLQTMKFRAAANATGGPLAFSWRVQDNGGTGNGAVDTVTDSIDIRIANTNQAPVLSGANAMGNVAEDAAANGGTLVSDLLSGHVTDLNVNPLSGIAVTAIDTSRGSWEYSIDGGTTWAAMGAVDDTSARLLASDSRVRFVPAAQWNGTVSAALTFRAWDRSTGTTGALASASVHGDSTAFSDATASSDITVTPVNDAPVRTAGTLTLVSVPENAPMTSLGLGALNYGPGGGIDEAGQSYTIRVTALPTALGDILLSDGSTVVTVGGVYQLSDLQGMQFRAAFNASGGPFTFAWEVQDNGGTAGGGIDTLAEELEIQVTTVNQAPVLSGALPLADVAEDATTHNGTLVRDLVTGKITDANANAVQGIAVTAVDETNGLWQYSRDGGGSWSSLTGVSDGTARLLAADAQTRVRFVPNANWNGTVGSGITFRAWDRSSGTAGQTEDTSSHGGNSAFSDATASAAVTVTAVNDAPVRSSGTVADLTVLENAGATSLGLNGIGYAPGGGSDENLQDLTITVTGLPTGLGDIVLANGTTLVTVGGTYQLSDLQGMQFRAAANASGGPATFTWRVQDNGGTTGGGVDLLNESLQIRISNENQAPQLAAANPLDAINEDATGNNGTLVSALVAGQVTDLNVNAVGGIAVVGVDTTRGSWEYSVNGGSTWATLAGTSDGSARLLAADAQTRVRFVPNADWNGTVTGGLSFRAWDRTSGTAGDLANITAHGGNSAFSDAIAGADIQVVAVNDAPVRSAGTVADLTVLENAGTTSLNLTGLDYAVGPANESGQGLTFTITALPTGLGDILLADGNPVVLGGTYTILDLRDLAFRAAANATGGPQAFSWRVQDNGGTTGGGADSLVETLDIRISNANQAPVLTAGNALAGIAEDATGNNGTLVSSLIAGQVVDRNVGALAGIAVTAVDTTHGTWEYSLDGGTAWSSLAGVTDDAARLLAADALTRVRFVPAADWNGTVTGGLVFRAWDRSTGLAGDLADTRTNDGSTAFSGTSASSDIVVSAVNDAPVRSAGTVADLHVDEDSGATALGFGGATPLNYSPGGGTDEASQLLAYTVTTLPPASLGRIVLSNGNPVSTGTVYDITQLRGMRFETAPEASGTATFAFTVSDGVDTLSESLAIVVNLVDDPTVATADTAGALEDSSVMGNVLTNDVDIDTPLAVGSFRVGVDPTVHAAGSTVSLTGIGSFALQADGSFLFTPLADWNGTAPVVTYTTNTGATATLTIVVAPVDDPTVANADTKSAPEDSTATGNVLTNDDDVDTLLGVLNFRVAGDATVHAAGSTATIAGIGSFTLDGNGDYSFTPLANWNGTVPVVSYTTVTGASSTLAITITPVADPTTVAADTVTVAEDSTATGNVLANDSDPDGPLAVATYTVAGDATVYTAGEAATVAGIGTFVLGVSGSYTFTPAANWNGSVPLVTYTTDTWSTSTLQITVTPVADPTVTADDAATIAEDTVATGNVLANDVDPDGPLAVASFSVAGIAVPFTAGQTATVTGVGSFVLAANGDYSFTPAPDWNGAAPLVTYTTDTGVTGTLRVTVTAQPDPSTVVGDSLTIAEDTVAAGNVLANDTDPDGPLTVTSFQVAGDSTVYNPGQTVAIAGLGTLVVDANGDYTFTPAPDYNGAASFSYAVSDGNGGTASGTLNVTVTPVNDAPVAGADTASTAEDTPLVIPAASLAGNDTDVDGDTLTVTAVGGAVNGTVSLSGGNVTFTPTANYNGAASFTYTVSDGNGGSVTSTVNVTVTAVNDAPVAGSDSATTAEDTPLVIPASNLAGNDTDADGDTLTVTAVGGAVNGTVSLSGGNVTFTPTANYNGPASFTYTVSDGNGGTTTGTVNVTVTPVNDAPAANPVATSTAEDTPLVISASTVAGNASDVDGDTLTVTAVGSAVNGTVSMSGGTITFTPTGNYNGAGSFTYTVSDGNGGTATNTVNVTVTPVNDAPAANTDNVTTAEDTSLVMAASDLALNDTDADGNALTVVAVANAVHGTVSLSGGTITFTPAANYNGPASFTYTVDDGNGGFATGTVSIAVTAVNDAPVANADSASTAEDTALVIPAADLAGNDTDVDGDTLTVTAVGGAVNGTVSLSGGNVTFTPTANYNGPASFTYTLSDGNGGTVTGTVNVTVTPVNDAPAATTDTASTPEDMPLVIPASSLAGNDSDVDGDSLTVTAVGGAVHGTVAMSGGTITFTPTGNYNGPASFTYTVSDGNGGTATGTVNVTVTAVNDAPVAAADTASTAEDTPLVIPASSLVGNDNDVDGDTLTVTAVGGAVNGTVSMTGGTITFTPTSNYNGAASFTYTVSDGNGGTATGTVAVTVTPVNDAPTTNTDSVTTAEDTPLVIPASNLATNDTDIDGDTVTVTSVGSAVNGTVTLSGGTVTFTPTANYNGPASFTYTVSDGNGGTATGTVNVTVTPANDAPIANAETVSTAEDTPLVIPASTLAGNDTDIDGDTLTVTAAGGAVHGTVSLVGGVLTFTPQADYNGSASFSYTVSDGHGGSASATVTVNVTPVNDAPVAQDGTAAAQEGQAVTGQLAASDVDAGDALTYALLTGPVNGTVTVLPNGGYTYTHNGSETLSDAFTFLVTDAAGATSIARIDLTITPMDDPTVTVADTATGAEDSIVSGNVLTNDSDPDSALAVSTFQVAGAATVFNAGQTATVAGVGSFVLAADGSYSFTPVTDWNGTAPLVTYTTATGASSTLQVTVTAVDDATDANDDAQSVAEDTAANGNVLQNDTDVDTVLSVLDFRIAGDSTVYTAGQSVALAGIGSFRLDADGRYAFTPLADWNGSVPAVTYTTNTGATATLSLVVTPVNDAPVRTSGAIADATIVEGGATSLGLNTLAYSPGGGSDEASQAITITATSLPDAALGRVVLANGTTVLAGSSYTLAQWQGLRFVPANGVNGDTTLGFSFSDGTATVTGESLRIHVSNQAPVLAGANLLPDVPEDATGNLGMAVSDLIAGQASDPGGVRGIAVVSARDGNGDWQFSRDGGGTWSSLAGTSDGASELLAAGALDRIRFVPHADWNGSASGLVFRAWDGSGGTASASSADTRGNGGSSPFSATTAMASVQVLPVNDAPHVIASGATDLFLNPDNASSSLGLQPWAFGPGGGGDEAAQSLTITITAAPAQLGTLQQADGTVVHAGDTLTLAQFQGLRLVPSASGGGQDGQLQWTVRDSGGTALGGVDQVTGSMRIAMAPAAAAPAPAPAPVVAAPTPAPAPATVTPAPTPAAAPAPAVIEPAPRPANGAGAGVEEALLPNAPVLPTQASLEFGFTPDRRPGEEAARPLFMRTLQERGEIQLVGYATPAEFQVLGFSNVERSTSRAAAEDLRMMLRSGAFVDELNRFREQLRQEFNLDKTTSITVAGLSLGVSVVYILWLIRGGVLLGSYLSALPAWRLLDPLPVLARAGEEEEDEDEEPLHQARAPADPLRGFA